MLFYRMDHITPTPPDQYRASLPEPMQYAASNYLRQLFSDMLLIKVKVFLGGLVPGVDPHQYGPAMAHDFDTMIQLNPLQIEHYFYTNATLPWIDSSYVPITEKIMKPGLDKRFDEWIIPFLIGFDYFFFASDSEHAIPYIRDAIGKRGPEWLKTLFARLQAENGQLVAAKMMLRALYLDEKDPRRKQRYALAIDDYNHAILVQDAISRYFAVHHLYPETLDDLVPEFLDQVNVEGNLHVLDYSEGKLRLLQQ